MNSFYYPVARVLVAATATLSTTAAAPSALAARAGGPLVAYDEAARIGLERAWFAQVPVDASRSRVSTWYLHTDRLYAVTDSGLVTALEAETGRALWSKQLGRPGVSAFGPAANDEYLGVVSGAKMYLLERETGRIEWSRDLGSAPSSGPALSNKYAYVALVTGRIEGYQLDDPAAQPWYYQSKGRTYLRPTTTGSVVSWPTAEGYLYVSKADDPGVRFRLETNADIVTSPAERAPYLYVASLDGYLYCMNETTGVEKWRYSTGYEIMSSPALVGDHAYVASMEPVLHCLDTITGQRLWAVAGASHFGAEGKTRVYASDRYGNLIVIDAQTGALLGRLQTAEGLETMVNDQTDRVFLVNDRGLVQCLREIGAEEPTLYRKPVEPATPPAADEAAPEDEAVPEDEENFFATGEPAEPVEEPAEEAEAAEEDNPFGL
jgi:outer membrane protein assembly factor BamB